jgi:hypothetical protein
LSAVPALTTTRYFVGDDQVVDDAALGIQHARVEGFARQAQLGDVVGDQLAQPGLGVAALHVDRPHVRDIEHTGIAADDVMLLQLRTVVDGHVPAGEIDHLGAGGDVGIIKRCSFSHYSMT